MRKLIERCPACGDHMAVRRMECLACDTAVDGQFQPSSFDRLSPESLAFVELFVLHKGNLKEMERELTVPYSTVRHRLDDVVRELEASADHPPTPIHDPAPSPSGVAAAKDGARQNVLERLEKGEITPDEAVKLLGGTNDE